MPQAPLRADVLAVFVKVPTPGRVKTRLAQAVGAEAAAAMYAQMGRLIVAACVVPTRYRAAVWFAPADGKEATRSWLNRLAVDDFLGQPEGDLDLRLSTAFAHHFARGARRVVVIGSDCPDVDHALVQRAFHALAHNDLVIGPALDGGFYLLGLTSPAATLFRGVAWSTDAVCRQTRENARGLGLSVALLPALRDVDTIEDAHLLGLLPSDTPPHQCRNHHA